MPVVDRYDEDRITLPDPWSYIYAQPNRYRWVDIPEFRTGRWEPTIWHWWCEECLAGGNSKASSDEALESMHKHVQHCHPWKLPKSF